MPAEDEDCFDHDQKYQFDIFSFFLNNGVRAGGGIGDVSNPPKGFDAINYRFFFDMSFYLIINVIWLNIIQGIIVDYFGS
jgi:hypothetical protein